jgi:hypothetical protein
MPHVDQSVYRIAAFRAPRQDPTQTLLWQGIALLSRRAAMQSSGAGLAMGLRDLLQAAPGFHQVDRVCLAKCVGNSNQLEIVDAWMPHGMNPGRLVPGYRCVVDPEGSLMRLKPEQVRIFCAADEVVASFKAQGRPVQRSIGLIQKTGLSAGLCLPLFSAGQRLGFLFLNSRVMGAFDGMDEDADGGLRAVLIALAGQAAVVELLAMRNPTKSGEQRALKFEPTAFMEALQADLKVAEVPPVSLTILGDGGGFVVVSHLIEATLSALLALQIQTVGYTLRCVAGHTEERSLLDIVVEGQLGTGFQDRRRLQALTQAANYGFILEFRPDGFRLSWPFDPAPDLVPYSV